MLVARWLILSATLVVFANGQAALAQVTAASVKDSVDLAKTFLLPYLAEAAETGAGSGEASLAAYAMIKAGEDANGPVMQKIVAEVASRAKSSKYRPGSHGVYAAGVEAMLLEAANPTKYREEIQGIVDYIIKQQHATGGWDYENGWQGGDTSQCQYALLGLWAAERAGIKVPAEVWDKAGQWFLRAQSRDGGFSYHPFGANAPPNNVVSHAMTAAGVGSLMLIRMHLYPNEKPDNPKPAKPPTTKFGVLESVDLDAVEAPNGTVQANPNIYKPTVSSSALNDSAKRAFAWLASRFTVTNEISSGGVHGPYYLYTLERMSALLDLQQIAGHDWFSEGAGVLFKSQLPNGSWTAQLKITASASTSLAVLFLLRTTAKTLHREVPFDPLGAGLLAGGRGLPDDLNQAIVKDGKVESVKDLGPIDQLLAELDKVESVDIAATQSKFIEKVVLGDREELIKQKDRLLKLAKHPNADVRRTAIWALGRTEDLKVARLLIAALDENDVDVMLEARNALCILSRKPLGFGLPESPYHGLPDTATDEAKQAAVKLWREKVKAKWTAWYYKYRPYEERDDLSETLFRIPK